MLIIIQKLLFLWNHNKIYYAMLNTDTIKNFSVGNSMPWIWQKIDNLLNICQTSSLKMNVYLLHFAILTDLIHSNLQLVKKKLSKLVHIYRLIWNYIVARVSVLLCHRGGWKKRKLKIKILKLGRWLFIQTSKYHWKRHTTGLKRFGTIFWTDP